ncbi:MAG TPA: pyridoxal-phosphate dependent enzyme, partial [Aggregatilineales bacterium]|nr:pyridoxal-phosphate dependent enzyme [Aggregatilineales bacterium]
TAVEPAESPVLSGGESGSHHIEGMGVGFIPPLWNADVVDSVISFSSENAMQMARRLSSEEGIFAGTSTGANVLAALQVASELGEGATVVTVAIDSGLKYLSTALYRGD